MRIKVLPRKYFINIKGTDEEALVFKKSNVISINTPEYKPRNIIREEPPFSRKYLDNDNVLVEYFHDWDKPMEGVVLMSDDDADKIFDFVTNKIDKTKTLLIHCTAGISRSGAVGYVLNEYFNKFLESDKLPNDDYLDFGLTHHYIIPNVWVKQKLLKKFELI